MHADPHPSAGSASATPAFDINQLALHASLTIMSQAALLANWIGRKLSHGDEIDKDKVMHLCASLHGMAQYLGVSAVNGYLNDALSEKELAVVLTAVPPEMANINLRHVDHVLMHTALGLQGAAGRVVDALRAQYETGVLNQTAVDDALSTAGHILGQALDAGGA